ncbi:MAG: hypothetical protein R2825_02085 [Saprospiraceae bacterium]
MRTQLSEGFDMSIIKQITDQDRKCRMYAKLDVDPAKATNRTVKSPLSAEPEPVIKAAFLAIKSIGNH